MKNRISLEKAIKISGYRKQYLAEQLGIRPESFSRLLSSPQKITANKLQLEKLLSILQRDVDEINWS